MLNVGLMQSVIQGLRYSCTIVELRIVFYLLNLLRPPSVFLLMTCIYIVQTLCPKCHQKYCGGSTYGQTCIVFTRNCEPCLVRSTRMLFSIKQQRLLERLRKLVKTGIK
jgi:hypothetical protein